MLTYDRSLNDSALLAEFEEIVRDRYAVPIGTPLNASQANEARRELDVYQIGQNKRAYDQRAANDTSPQIVVGRNPDGGAFRESVSVLAIDDDTRMPPHSDDLPFHGENTPITPIATLEIQAGLEVGGSAQGKLPYLDLMKYSKNPYLERSGVRVLDDKDQPVNKYLIGTFPAEAQPGDSIETRTNFQDSLSAQGNATDIAGEIIAYSERGTEFRLVLTPPENFTVLEDTPTSKRFQARDDGGFSVQVQITASTDDSPPPVMLRVKDATDADLSAVADYAAGFVSSAEWRKALFGYSFHRQMNRSGGIMEFDFVIRYDQLLRKTDAGWNITSVEYDLQWITGGNVVAAQNRDLVTGTGAPRGLEPLQPKIKTAHEMGAVYHHTLTPYLFEHRGSYSPATLGAWAEQFFADTSIPLATRESILNDYELQHIDAMGAEISSYRYLLRNNQIVVEVGNESSWNNAFPYTTSLGYFERKYDDLAVANGWPTLPPQTTKAGFMIGYFTAKMVARLRKKFPAIEWVGALATQTANITNFRNPASNPQPPATASGFFNLILHGIMNGVGQFWADFAADAVNFSRAYASQPVSAGHWFAVFGTTYSYTNGFPEDTTETTQNVIANYQPSALVAAVADELNWPVVAKTITQFWLDESVDFPGRPRPIGNSYTYALQAYTALAEHAAALGMQVRSYEGGFHADLGRHFGTDYTQWPGRLHEFWTWFMDTVECALLECANHDAAVASGWKTIADFGLISPNTTNFRFGNRKHFFDVTPRYIELGRLFPASPPVPKGLENANLQTVRQRFPDAVRYFDEAAANGYYMGANSIPTAAELLAFGPSDVFTLPGTIVASEGLTQSTEASFTWTEPSGSPTSYTAQIREVGQTAWTTLTLASPTDRAVNATGLTIETDYEFRVRGENTRGVGPWSNTVTVTTLGVQKDFYVDQANGSDANDGSSLANAWQTLTPLRTALDAVTAGQTRTAFVAAGVYTDQHLNLSTFAGVAEIEFEAGCEIRWTLGTDQSGIQSGNFATGELTILGNGLIIDGFNAGTGNGLGCTNSTIKAFDVRVRNCIDGGSAHQNGRFEATRCSFKNCTKSGVAHVNDSTSRHVDCYIEDNGASLAAAYTAEGAGLHEFVRCTIAPINAARTVSGNGNTLYTQCRLGNFGNRIQLQGVRVEDSFVDASIEMNQNVEMLRAYGLLSVRMRSGGSLDIDNCVFTGGAVGTTDSLLWNNFDAGSWAPVTIDGTVITGYTTAIAFANATNRGYWDASVSAIDNIAIFGNTANFDAEAALAQRVTNVSTVDPGLGSATGLSMANYATTTPGVGFAASDVVTTGCPDAVRTAA